MNRRSSFEKSASKNPKGSPFLIPKDSPLGFANKCLGQHFLASPRIAERIVAAADVRPSDTILEIGPGTGILTEKLIASGARVIAVEKDTTLAEALRKRFGKKDNFTIIEGDIRDFLMAPKGLPFGNLESVKVVANIPYYLTGHLFRLLVSDRKHPPCLLVLMVQKEVAERIVATKKTNLLGLSVQPFMIAKIVFRVGRAQFRPPPNVDSAVLVLERRSRENHKGFRKRYFALLKITFSQKRKMAFPILKKHFGNQISDVFEACNIPKTARAEDISLDGWLCLAKHQG